MNPILKYENDTLKVYGEVYVPMRLDTDNAFMRASEIEKALHCFQKLSKTGNVDLEHNKDVVNGEFIVENFIARENDPMGFIPGSWIAAGLISDVQKIEGIKNGTINGWSMEGNGQKIPRTVQITALVKADKITDPVSVKGQSHVHKFTISFDEAGKVNPTETAPAEDGHYHNILRTTATEPTNGHAHRFDISWHKDDPGIVKAEREIEAIELVNVHPEYLSLVGHAAIRRGFKFVKTDDLPEVTESDSDLETFQSIEKTEPAEHLIVLHNKGVEFRKIEWVDSANTETPDKKRESAILKRFKVNDSDVRIMET